MSTKKMNISSDALVNRRTSWGREPELLVDLVKIERMLKAVGSQYKIIHRVGALTAFGHTTFIYELQSASKKIFLGTNGKAARRKVRSAIEKGQSMSHIKPVVVARLKKFNNIKQLASLLKSA